MQWRLVALWVLVGVCAGQACYQGCFECDPITKMCSACYEGFELTILGSCAKAELPFCNLYLTAGQCMRCLPTYVLIDGACQRDYSGCLQNSTTLVCTKCSAELALNNGKCLGVLNCLRFDGVCLECGSGFSLVKGACVASSSNCVSAHPTNGVCQQCQKGFDLVAFKCVSALFYNPNCYLYNEAGNCLLCKDGYLLIQGNCYGRDEANNLRRNLTAASPVPAFTTTTTPTLPQTQQLNSAGGSITIPNNPNNPNNPNAPTNTPTPTPSPAAPRLEIIAEVTSTPQSPPVSYAPEISQQLNALLLDSSQLTSALNKTNVYCKTFSHSGCATCYQGFYLREGLCVQIDPLCKKFNQSVGQCESCYVGYALTVRGGCVLAKPAAQDPNCHVFAEGQCVECYSNYFIKLGVCIANDPLCRESYPNGSCASCFDGYQLVRGGCEVDENATPNIFDPYCISIQGVVCLRCVNGYYIGSNGICVPLSLNCLKHNLNDGTCLKCIEPFLLLGLDCVFPVENCVSYKEGKCERCPAGYFLKMGLCYMNDVTCAAYDSVGSCVQCVPTYFLVGGQCVFPSLGYDALCTAYSNSYCVECQRGSFLSNYRCRAIDASCDDFDLKNLRCNHCANGRTARGIGCI